MNHVLVPRLCNNTPQRSHLLLITHHAFINPLASKFQEDGWNGPAEKNSREIFGHFGDDSSKKNDVWCFFLSFNHLYQ